MLSDLHAEVGQDGVGRIVLNRPRALNALTLEMLREIARRLDAWEADGAVGRVLIQGAGERGLCAGGDVRALHDAVKAGDPLMPERFFREEYRLNARLARYPKPIIAIMDGTVMGGGIGLSAHVSHRVVTERSILAMPETAIGFVPDVGATFLLSRAPGELGTHLALSGARLSGADAILCGLADRLVPAARLPALCDDPCQLEAAAETPPASGLAAQRDWIDRCYAFDSIEEIVEALHARAEPQARMAAAALARMSPTSLKVTLRALRGARRLARLESCLDVEFRVAMAMMRPDGDFIEGVRAVLVDKDRNPRWLPGSLAEVSEALVARHFDPLPGRELQAGGG